jgi:hypothetical protein
VKLRYRGHQIFITRESQGRRKAIDDCYNTPFKPGSAYAILDVAAMEPSPQHDDMIGTDVALSRHRPAK